MIFNVAVNAKCGVAHQHHATVLSCHDDDTAGNAHLAGTPDPTCYGFSQLTVAALQGSKEPFKLCDFLTDEDIQQVLERCLIGHSCVSLVN